MEKENVIKSREVDRGVDAECVFGALQALTQMSHNLENFKNQVG